MKRIFNYNTGKLYESDGVYNISVFEKSLSDDVVISPEDEERECKQIFYSYKEAMDVIKNSFLLDICDDEGFDINDGEIDITENGLIFTIPDYKSWEFVISCDSDVNEEKGENDDENKVNEENKNNGSVSSRFSRLRALFEEAGLDEDKDEDEDSKDKKDDDSKDDSKDDSDDKSNDDSKDDSDEEESETMRAVIITVDKKDVDKCKDELIDAGIEEDDIDVLKDDDDDKEDVDIRIDVNSVLKLKDYLDKKGIDLEKEIGGEIVDDSDDSDDENDDSENSDDSENDDFDFNDLGDLFGAEDSEE